MKSSTAYEDIFEKRLGRFERRLVLYPIVEVPRHKFLFHFLQLFVCRLDRLGVCLTPRLVGSWLITVRKMKSLIALLFSCFSFSVLAHRNPPTRDQKVRAVAAVLYSEAGGETSTGIRAVAEVILNRIRPGKDAYAVVTERKQFSCLNRRTEDQLVRQLAYMSDDGRYASTVNFCMLLASMLVDGTYKGLYLTKGANHYHNKRVRPYWADPAKETVRIGHHIFYKL